MVKFIVNREKTVVLFGSDFPADQSDLVVCQNIQAIKACMADGRTVVLIHSGTIAGFKILVFTYQITSTKLSMIC